MYNKKIKAKARTHLQWNILRELTQVIHTLFCDVLAKLTEEYGMLNVTSQMTLTVDDLICHRICATYDIEMILGRFGPCEVSHAAICQVLFQYHKLHRFY